MSSLAPPEAQLHIMPIDSIYSSDSTDNVNRVKELLDSVTAASPYAVLTEGFSFIFSFIRKCKIKESPLFSLNSLLILQIT